MNNTRPSLSTSTIVLLGLVALAIAMGIGRFAFTPLMPLMVRDGRLDAATATEWAVANYMGYLLGALSASCFKARPERGLGIGMLGVMLTTLAMALLDASMPLSGAMLRAAAGACSAWVLVCTSSWCLPELARRRAATAGSWVYSGVGLGIAATGIISWIGGAQSAQALWLELGGMASIGTLWIWRTLSASPASAALPQSPADKANHGSGSGHAGLVFCYGVFGFGYIVPATYLPSMARQLVPDPRVFGLVWPVFGMAAALGVALSSRWLSHYPRRLLWSWAQGLMALGTLLPLLQPSLWTLTLSAVLVGATFMVVTMAGLQLAREYMPHQPAPLLIRMTSSFALGQISGPLLVRLIGDQVMAGWQALDWANALATTLLVATSIWLWRGSKDNQAALSGSK
ncbi:MAG: YbfB/YjiJ family MFS transporter [Aquitalea sp.]|nr:YbfB/YjiJ family MFS transporter [Aquitalea sp.]